MTDPQRLASRTNSIWLSQLLLAVVVVVVVLVTQAVAPESMQQWSFTVGVATIVVITAIALIAPWARLPASAALVIPILDIVAVGAMNADTNIDLAFLWAFPVIWIASHYGSWAIASSIGLISVMVVAREVATPGNTSATLRVIVVTLTLTFVAISTRISARQTQAFKRLLLREAGKLNQALARVTRQERHVSQMLATIDVGIARISPTGDVVEFNDTYRDLYGIASTDPTAPPTSVEYDAFQGAPIAPADRPLQRARRGEQFDDARTWLFDTAGTWHALSLVARALPDADGAGPSGSLLIAHNITAMLRAEQARQMMTARLSHELRNPLTTVIGFSDLLLDGDEVSGRTRERVNEINMAGQRMIALTDTILSSGTATPTEEVHIATTDLAPIVSASVDSFMPTADALGVTVEWTPVAEAYVIGDAFRLRQVVDNLLSNAIKYTSHRGTVTLTVTRLDTTVSLDVRDTGHGMSAEEVSRVYEPYYRTPAAVASTVQGTGLGMGIVRSLVEQHNGSVSIRSVPMHGTTVTVSVPAASVDSREQSLHG